MSDFNENSQELIDIVTENKNLDDNAILGLLIGQGVLFNKAKGILNKILVSQGLRMTKAQRDDKAEELLAAFSVTDETTAEEVSDQIDMLMDELDCTKAAARIYVKAMFDEAEIAFPKVATTGGGKRGPKAPGMSGDVRTSANFALENPEEIENDKEAFKDYMDANGGSTTRSGKDKSGNWYSAVVDLRLFGKEWLDKHCN